MQIENSTTNFTSQAASDAESNLATVITSARFLGVENFQIKSTVEEIISLVEKIAPERLALVSQKHSGNLAELSHTELIDKLLGIDATLKMNGKHIGIDVTTGKGGVLANKKRRTEELKAIYSVLGLDHFLVLRLRAEFSEDLLINLLSQIESIISDPQLSQEFVHVIKL